MVPKNLVRRTNVPNQLGLLISDLHSLLSGQTEYSRDHFSRTTKFFGTICPMGPNVQGPYGFGTKYVRAKLLVILARYFSHSVLRNPHLNFSQLLHDKEPTTGLD